jgi:hypothetical protein
LAVDPERLCPHGRFAFLSDTTRVAAQGPAMEPDPACFSAGPLERQLLAQLLTETRRRAGLDLKGAAQRWGQPTAHLHAVETGGTILDWWELRRLLSVYERGLLAFVVEFEERLGALSAAPSETGAFLADPLR